MSPQHPEHTPEDEALTARALKTAGKLAVRADAGDISLFAHGFLAGLSFAHTDVTLPPLESREALAGCLTLIHCFHKAKRCLAEAAATPDGLAQRLWRTAEVVSHTQAEETSK